MLIVSYEIISEIFVIIVLHTYYVTDETSAPYKCAYKIRYLADYRVRTIEYTLRRCYIIEYNT